MAHKGGFSSSGGAGRGAGGAGRGAGGAGGHSSSGFVGGSADMAASSADLALTKSFFSGAAGAEEDGHAEEDDSGIPDASAQRKHLPIAAGAAVERFPLATNCKLFAVIL